MYTTFDRFTESTRPSLSQLEKFIEDVSAIVQVQLDTLSLVVPVGSTLEKAIRAFVSQQVADLVLMVNERGRFGPRGQGTGTSTSPGSAYGIIVKDVRAFLREYAIETGSPPTSIQAKFEVL